MRALVIAPQPFFSPRGTPFSVYYRTLAMAREGVEIDLLTYGEGQDVDIPGVRLVRIPRVRALEPVPVGPSPNKLLLDVLLVLWTIGLLLRHRYDFVHAHEESVFFCRWLKPVFRFRLVYDMHSCLPQQLTNFAFTRSRFLIGAFERLERSALRAADAVVTICPELAEYALPRLADPARHLLIENSLFEEVRLRGAVPGAEAPAAADGVGPVIAYAGTFEPYQGLDLLVEAFAGVLRERPDARLLLVGGNPEQIAALRALAERTGVTPRCTLTGRLPQGTTRRLLARAAVLVSPRRHGTNTPLKVYEQLASGIPMVATRIRSHTQVLDERVCLLAEPEPAALAAALMTALAGGPAVARTTAAARALYDEKYSPAAYAAKIRRLLGLLDGRSEPVGADSAPEPLA
ncbi:MAG: glycosyltransferase [Acidobacteria bacterium]|nr:glycosyltransferase [Acidobacteriota bacterium]